MVNEKTNAICGGLICKSCEMQIISCNECETPFKIGDIIFCDFDIAKPPGTTMHACKKCQKKYNMKYI
ncbi:MAG: hypothetical protein BWK75_01345 [Candidatus Altiarchaeales archaeon A3]|nr:MAG: hypothetical protein BWK75_01345 [Candidatus Altiarchaeales archaeon A3]